MVRSVSCRQAAAFRLARHNLSNRAPRSELAGVVSMTLGLQAQVMTGAELAARVRVKELRQADLADALLTRRSLVKTWAMRGTLHLLPAEAYGLLVAALRPSGIRRELGYLARKGWPAPRVAEITEAVLAALDNRCLTRRELADAVVGELGETVRDLLEHGFGEGLRPAAVEGQVCFGPSRGQEVTFVRTDQWLGAVRAPSETDAQQELARRYLAAYGPATPQDLASWSGMAVREVRSIWQDIRDELAEIDLDGRPVWVQRSDLEELEAARSGAEARLLPSFDPLLLAHRDKSWLVDELHYGRVYRKAGWISPIVLAHQRIAGIWAIKRHGRRVDLLVEPFAQLSRDTVRQLEDEARDIARFLGQDLHISIAMTEEVLT